MQRLTVMVWMNAVELNGILMTDSTPIHSKFMENFRFFSSATIMRFQLELPLLASLEEGNRKIIEDRQSLIGSCDEKYLVDRRSVSMWMNSLCMYPEP